MSELRRWAGTAGPRKAFLAVLLSGGDFWWGELPGSQPKGNDTYLELEFSSYPTMCLHS